MLSDGFACIPKFEVKNMICESDHVSSWGPSSRGYHLLYITRCESA